MIIKRDDYLKQLIAKRDNGRIKIITGIRRCGKSYLLFELYKKHLLENNITKEQIIEIALDDINNNLRGIGEAVEYPLSKDDKIYIEQLDQATQSQTVKEKTLYRSTDISTVIGDISDLDYDNLKSAYIYNDKSKPAKEALEKYLKDIEDKEIFDKGFISTTKSKEIALDFQDFTGSSKPCVIEFNVPKGIKGIDLKDFDIEDMEQKEFLKKMAYL